MTRKDKTLLTARGDSAPKEILPAVATAATAVIMIARRVQAEVNAGNIPRDSFESVFHEAVRAVYQ